MALHIEEHRVLAFDENTKLAFEQNASRLKDTCDVRTNVVGKAKSFNRIIGEDADEKTSSQRHADHTQSDLDGIVSWAVLRYFYKALPLDPDDEDKVLSDPKNVYSQGIAGAKGRKLDELIIAAAVGNATRGESMGSSVALPSAQKVAAASVGMTVAKLLTAKQKLDAAEIPMEDRYLALNAKGAMDLLNEDEVKSFDFNTQKVLADGQLESFLGFKIKYTEKITTSTGSVAYHKSAIGVAIARDHNTVWQRTDKHGAWEAYGSIHFGAVRAEDKGIVQINFV